MDMAGRRSKIGAAAMAPLMAMFEVAAVSTELALMCDVTLGATLLLAADAYRASTGVRVQVFPTAPGLIVPMLSRDVLIDIVMTRLQTLEEATKAGVLKSGSSFGTWRTPIVVARPAGSTADGKFAVSELPSASGIDAQAAMAELGIDAARIVSAIDTQEVVFLLRNGTARSGLMYLTDAKTDPSLCVAQTLTGPPPAVFGAAITKGSGRPNPAGFIAFLSSAPIRMILNNNGLEHVG